jgi:hypothetical protein
MPVQTDTDAVRTLISYNRPLTRDARRDLQDYGIVDERSVGNWNHWTEVDVEECPPEELLEKHELRLEDPTGGADPEKVYETHQDERVEIYPDAVFLDGEEQSIDSDEAAELAERNGWEAVDE